MKVEIELGVTAEKGLPSRPALMDVGELLATRLLIQGNSGSGKTHLLRRLLEQSAPSVQQIIIDPEGDFAGMSSRYGHVIVDANRSEAELAEIGDRVRQHRISAVLTLEHLDSVELQMRAAAFFLNALFDADREFWYPAIVAVDEAQIFAPAAAGEVSDEARKVSLGAMTNLMCRGRKRGLAGILATQRLAKLAKNCAAECTNFLMGRTFLDIDMVRASELLGMERRQAEAFRDLQRGEFVALGPALSRRPLPISVGSVETAGQGATPELTPPPRQSIEEARDIILAPMPSVAPVRARAVTPPPTPTDELLAQALLAEVSREAKPSDIAADEAPSMSAEERATMFREIASEIMAEPEAAFQAEAVLYQDFLVRYRIRRVVGAPLNLADFKRYLNVARAGTAPQDAERPEWQAALSVVNGMEEGLQAIYLLLARAAMAGAPCPADMEIARVCGSRSPGRGRSRLQSLEQAAYIVIRKDMRGNRSVALPDLGCETTSGDPAGALAAVG
ncbi:hypothetical protein SAMN05444161_3042 [Rhizobiales bacterium GAS191]|jgi:hypothetical protein|nr:hypothetical protein SAMN05519103_02239 [Rhizobiales bacterium GAS113]SED36132.1 hypothetical protein SAMN05444161_3042 [Rhizobiales bacterium GAS191]